MKKIKPWMIVAGAAVAVWWLTRPKTSGAAAGAATSAGSGSGGYDAGRAHHHRFHGVRGGVSPSYMFVGTDYAGPCTCEACACT